jgi:hypothetical protein
MTIYGRFSLFHIKGNFTQTSYTKSYEHFLRSSVVLMQINEKLMGCKITIPKYD